MKSSELRKLATQYATGDYSPEPHKSQVAPKRHTETPATDKQRAYLVTLGVRLEGHMSVARASQLIDAAKCEELGSFGGWDRDGSN